MTSPRLALGTSLGPAICLLNVETGQSVPISTPLDHGGAFFSHGLGRRGWEAAQVECRVGAYVDGGDLASPVLLPEAWQMFPAATDDLVLITPYPGRSARAGERRRALVADCDGRVRRSVELPWTSEADVVGETAAGVVTSSGICGWDGQVLPLLGDCSSDVLVDPVPVGVLAGRVILNEDVNHLSLFDTVAGAVITVPVPQRHRRWPGAADPRLTPLRWDNSAGTWLAMSGRGIGASVDYVVAGACGVIRWLPDRKRAVNLWLEDKLVQWSYEDGRPIEYDPIADRFSPADVAPLALHENEVVPRIDVTGRVEWPL